MTINEIKKAADIIHAGGLVAFPTETVYGLGADATNADALANIFAAKERPYDHPLIVHIATINQLSNWARDISPHALKLAQAFWPGPLTLILKKQKQVLDIVTGGQDTVGLRIPRHPIAQALLQEFGGGIAAPSANKFTHISPTTAAAVHEELGDKVDMILDGGACEVGLESTIIDMSRDAPVILRPGMLSIAEIERVLGGTVTCARQDTPVRAPGMHHLHYAPTTKTILIDTQHIADVIANLTDDDLPIGLVHFSDVALTPKIHNMKMANTPNIYAHDIYHVLRTLDHLHLKRIVIERVPNGVEWDAIRDRLNKASA